MKTRLWVTVPPPRLLSCIFSVQKLTADHGRMFVSLGCLGFVRILGSPAPVVSAGPFAAMSLSKQGVARLMLCELTSS